MEKVDNEILEELNEEPIIVDGDGNAVILGSQD
jgi:hypothetical protein